MWSLSHTHIHMHTHTHARTHTHPCLHSGIGFNSLMKKPVFFSTQGVWSQVHPRSLRREVPFPASPPAAPLNSLLHIHLLLQHLQLFAFPEAFHAFVHPDHGMLFSCFSAHGPPTGLPEPLPGSSWSLLPPGWGRSTGPMGLSSSGAGTVAHSPESWWDAGCVVGAQVMMGRKKKKRR